MSTLTIEVHVHEHDAILDSSDVVEALERLTDALKLSENILDDATCSTVHDANGNSVGFWTVRP